MHSLFLKSKAALHSRLKLSGLCHTPVIQIALQWKLWTENSSIIFKSSKKKKKLSQTRHTALVSIGMLFDQNMHLLFVWEKPYTYWEIWNEKKTEHREKGLKGLECVENIHSNMEDLESSICQMCMSCIMETPCCEVTA